MAAAEPVGQQERTRSLDLLPPNLSELRVVLLGNSWSQRRDVGNIILGGKVFNSEEPDCCVRVSGRCKWKEMVLINTLDLLHPNMCEDKVMKRVENCVELSDPGPHVFLLVLQPEDFTEQQKLRLQTVLENCGDRSFEHSLVLLSAPKKENPGSSENYMDHPALKHMIQMCRFRYVKQKDLELLELLTRCGQIVKENNGEHVSCDLSEGVEAVTHPNLKLHTAVPANFDPARAAAHGLRIVLFGKSEEEKTTVGNFILKKKCFHFVNFSSSKQCESADGEWRGKAVRVVKTPDIFSLSVEAVRDQMRSCLSLCAPGPNVLLLLVKPSDFTEKNRQTLKFILSLFGEDSFKHSMVISTHCHQWNETSVSVNKLLQECDGRHYNMFINDHRLLMEKMENIVGEKRKTFHKAKSVLNLVLCGRRGAGKTSAAKAILGQTELHSGSNSSECVKNQAEVCGRRVSLVELPALCGKPQEAVMEESFRCVSLCDPEGVHAFILVLPVGPLTDEDKAELQTIQNTFSSRVNDFTMILFTVESDPTAPAVVNFLKENKDIQELCQSCGGRSVLLNIKDEQQIPELLEAVEKMRDEGARCFTFGMLTKTQMEKFSKLEADFQDVKQMLEKRNENESQTREQLRKALLKEMKTKEESHKKKQEEELKALQAEIKQERKLRIQQQKDKDECINKERERRKKEREEDERRWKKQEEAQRIDWKRKLDASDKRFHSEREQWESTEKKLDQCRRDMKRDRDAWDKERNNIWERVHQEVKQNLEEVKQNLEEEKTSHRKLQEEYSWKRKKWTYPWFALLLLIVLFLLYYVFQTNLHTSQRVL